jgi:hypothetical protein
MRVKSEQVIVVLFRQERTKHYHGHRKVEKRRIGATYEMKVSPSQKQKKNTLHDSIYFVQRGMY